MPAHHSPSRGPACWQPDRKGVSPGAGMALESSHAEWQFCCLVVSAKGGAYGGRSTAPTSAIPPERPTQPRPQQWMPGGLPKRPGLAALTWPGKRPSCGRGGGRWGRVGGVPSPSLSPADRAHPALSGLSTGQWSITQADMGPGVEGLIVCDLPSTLGWVLMAKCFASKLAERIIPERQRFMGKS